MTEFFTLYLKFSHIFYTDKGEISTTSVSQTLKEREQECI